jgi:hypothetical protein
MRYLADPESEAYIKSDGRCDRPAQIRGLAR